MPKVVKRSRRRPRDSLTRQQVVLAALNLADRDGLESLTMPNLARALECGVMTIYGYVESKDDLLGAIAQLGLSDLKLARPLPDKREAILVAWGRGLRQTLIAHPSLPAIFLAQAVVGRAIFRGLEALLGRLTTAGMTTAASARAVYAVLIYTTGFLAWELPRTARRPADDYAAMWRQEYARLVPGEFPLTGSVLGELGDVAGEVQFELGLGALARGLTEV